MKIQNVTDAAFKKYGKVVTGIDFSDMLAEMKKMEIPADVVYEPGLASLEACASARTFARAYTAVCRFRLVTAAVTTIS